MNYITFTLTALIGLGCLAAASHADTKLEQPQATADTSTMITPPVSQDSVVTLGALELTAPFARATLPNQPVAGGFLTITNTGDSDDTLVAVRSDAASRMEVHEMAMDGDVMKMRELEQGLPIPAGETVILKPGGFHIMFMDLAGPMAEGDSTEVTLVFANAGEVTLTMPIVARDGAGPGGHADHDTEGE